MEPGGLVSEHITSDDQGSPYTPGAQAVTHIMFLGYSLHRFATPASGSQPYEHDLCTTHTTPIWGLRHPFIITTFMLYDRNDNQKCAI